MNIFGILKETFRELASLKLRFLKALVLPILLIVVVDVVVINSNIPTLYFIEGLIELPFYAVIAINTHRILLLGPDSVPKWGIAIPTKRELAFLGYMLFPVLLFIPLALLLLIPFVGATIGVILMMYLLSRISLIYPATAIDAGWTLSRAWNETKNIQIVMILIVCIYPAFVGIPEYFIASFDYSMYLLSLVSAVSIVFIVSALSVTYKHVERNQNQS